MLLIHSANGRTQFVSVRNYGGRAIIRRWVVGAAKTMRTILFADRRSAQTFKEMLAEDLQETFGFRLVK